jgi:serine/threonine-protein kinase
LAQLTISNYDYELVAKIGAGNFGAVYAGVKKSTGEMVAITCIKDPLLPEQQRDFIRELVILAQNEHPATLRLIGFSITPAPGRTSELGPIHITPIMPNGHLDAMLKAARSGRPLPGWTPTMKSKCVFGIAVGMAYMHSKEVMHRDLKPENVFLDPNFEPVIADFGISRVCKDGDLSRTMGTVGTPLYMAPEIFGEETGPGPAYDVRVDVYSFAMLLYMFFCPDTTLKFTPGQPPRSAQQLMMHVLSGTRFIKPDKIPDFYWELIQQCWAPAWGTRPFFPDIVNEFLRSHEYAFDGTDMKALEEYENRLISAQNIPGIAPRELAADVEFDDELDAILSGSASPTLTMSMTKTFGASMTESLNVSRRKFK